MMIAGLTFISAQFVRPTYTWSKELPLMLSLVHFFSIIVAVSLFFNFLFELTSMKPATRFKVFRAELVKVFMTLVFFYFISLVFTSWLYQIVHSIQVTVDSKEHKQKLNRRQWENWKDSMLRNGYSLNEIEPYRAKEILSPAEHSIQ